MRLPLAALVLFITSPAGAASPRARSAPPEDCPPGNRIEINLTSWKAALKRAETPQRHAELLGELKLALDLGDAKPAGGSSENSSEDPDDSDAPAPAPSQVTLLAIDDTLAQLGSAALPDHVIQVSYRIHRGDEKTTAHLIQVARPFGGPRWCLLGSDLSRQDAGKPKLDSYGLGFVPLVNAKTKAIEVKVVQAQLRHGEVIRQYWVVDGFRLSKVFDQEIGAMDNIGGSGETMAKSGTIALLGEFPKRIEFKETTKRVICDADKADKADKADDVPCRETERSSKTMFTYDGKTYVRRK